MKLRLDVKNIGRKPRLPPRFSTIVYLLNLSFGSVKLLCDNNRPYK